MPLYTYKAKNESGKIISGEIKMSNQNDLAMLLSQKGFTSVEIEEKNIFTDISQLSIFKKKIKVKDIALFCRQFSIVLDAGVPIATALDVIRQQTENPSLKVVVSDIYDNIQKGISLSNALKEHANVFPEILISMVEAGEVSGQLDSVFRRMAEHFEKEYKTRQKVINSFMYPAIVLVVAAIVIFILMTYVIPTFSGVLRSMGANLPIYTVILMNISDFFTRFWWAIGIALVLAVFGIRYYSKTENGKILISSIVIKIPIIKGVTKALLTSRLTRTLSTLMASGVLLIQALEIVQKVLGNAVIMDKMEHVITEVKKGRGLSQPISDINYFPPMLESMLKIGEESGNMDFTLSKAADYYDEEVEASLERLMTFLEPLIIILLGGVVAFVIFSVIVPMFSVYQNMGNQ